MSDRDAPHPSLALDETVHQRVRLGILAMLSEATDGNLSRHLRVLEEAGLIHVRKGYEGRRPCTWLGLTRAGHRALRTEISALEQLVARLRRAERGSDD